MYPFHNDADENYEEKLRLHKDLNDVRIGHWKSHDGKEEYYSPVSIYVIEDMYAHGLKIFHSQARLLRNHTKFFPAGKYDCFNSAV